MLIKVTDIEFDFDSDDSGIGIKPQEMAAIVDSVRRKVWNVYEEEELVEAITDETGWLVKNISYENIFT